MRGETIGGQPSGRTSRRRVPPTTRRTDEYADAHPGPGGILLVVEVADTSAGYDRQRKLLVYARYGVPQAWLVNLNDDHIEVYREPGPEGYGSVRQVGRGGELEVQALTGLTLRVDEILG